MTDDAERLSRLIVDLRRLQRTAQKAASQEAGTTSTLTMVEREVLRHVANHPGIGTSGIAHDLSLKPNTVSGIVSRLVGNGYLTRSPNKRDRRATRLTLTETAERDHTARWEARADRVEAGMLRLDAAQRATIQGALPALEALRDAMREIRR